MSLNSDEEKLFNRVTSINLDNASEKLRKSQNFSFAGLKELHDKTFTPNQNLPPKVIAEMNNQVTEVD